MGGRLWTEQDLCFLRTNLGRKNIRSICRELNRTESAVLQKIYEKGLTAKLDLSDRACQKKAKANNAIKRSTYQKRKDAGICTRCGKRWSEAGRTRCRPCREHDQKWWRDNDMIRRSNEFKRALRAERKENSLCVNCGKPLEPNEIGVNSKCAGCRAKAMERTAMERLRMRLHGIKRKW